MLHYFVDAPILEIYQGFRRWKNYENWLAFGEVTAKSVGTRFGPPCILGSFICSLNSQSCTHFCSSQLI